MLAELADVLNVPVGEVVDGARKRLERDQGAARRGQGPQARRRPAARPATLAGQAVDGVVVERVDGARARHACATSPLAAARPARPPGGRARHRARGRRRGAGRRGHARQRASTPSALLEEAKKLIKGGGGKDPLLAVAGGKDADGLDAALDTVRAAAGIAGS